MDEKRQLEVSDWHDEPRPLPRADEPVSRLPRVPARALALIGTVLLHGLVIQTAVLGSSARTISSSTKQGLASAATATGADSDMILVVIQPTESSDSTEDSLFEDFGSRGSLGKMPISLISLEPPKAPSLPADEKSDSGAESPVNSGDPEGQVRLFGIYSGQIKARIDRIWRRPRTPINEARSEPHDAVAEESFRCQVRIIQDPQGNVQEILLPQCNGSSAWQRSLVIAIQQASPLPSPPSPSVFSQAMSLDFVGYSYASTQNDDDYENAKPLPIDSGSRHGSEQ